MARLTSLFGAPEPSVYSFFSSTVLDRGAAAHADEHFDINRASRSGQVRAALLLGMQPSRHLAGRGHHFSFYFSSFSALESASYSLHARTVWDLPRRRAHYTPTKTVNSILSRKLMPVLPYQHEAVRVYCTGAGMVNSQSCSSIPAWSRERLSMPLHHRVPLQVSFYEAAGHTTRFCAAY